MSILIDNYVIKKHPRTTYRDFLTDDNRKLVIIHPGIILNEASSYAWRALDNDSEYSDFIKDLMQNFTSSNEEQISSGVKSIIKYLYSKDFVEIFDCENNKIDSIELIDNIFNDVKDKNIIGDDNSLGFEPLTDVDLVITKGCNFKCKHCFVSCSPEETESDKIDINQWKDIIDSLCNLGLAEAKVTGGEPFTFPNIIELLDYLDQKNISIFVLTNGFLLNDQIVDRLSTYKKLIVQVSVDGASSQTHDILRNTVNSLDRIKQNIKLLRSKNIPVIMATTISTYSYEEVMNGDLFRLAAELKVNSLGVSPNFIKVGRAEENWDMALSYEKAFELIRFLNGALEDDLPFNMHIGAPPALTEENSLNNPNLDLPRCRRGINSCSINSEGLISVCTDFISLNYKPYKLGNLFEDDITTIWKNAQWVRKERKESIHKLKGVCSVCVHRFNCGGACRADAYALYGDIQAPYPLCQYLYENDIFPKEKIDNGAKYVEI